MTVMCRSIFGPVTGDTYCAIHGRGAGWPCRHAPALSPDEAAIVARFESAPDPYPCPDPADPESCTDQTACAGCPVGDVE